MADNGSGSAGGNGSVYWMVRSGAAARTKKGRRPAPIAPPGHVLVGDDLVQGHTRDAFRQIGRSTTDRRGQHPGLFRVRLRFRARDLRKLSPEQRRWVLANRDPDLSNDTDSYVVIYVPAIERKVRPNGSFDDEDWEIHWEW